MDKNIQAPSPSDRLYFAQNSESPTQKTSTEPTQSRIKSPIKPQTPTIESPCQSKPVNNTQLKSISPESIPPTQNSLYSSESDIDRLLFGDKPPTHSKIESNIDRGKVIGPVADQSKSSKIKFLLFDDFVSSDKW